MLLKSKTATGDPSIGLQLFCMKKVTAFDLLTCLHKQSYKQNVIMSKENMCFCSVCTPQSHVLCLDCIVIIQNTHVHPKYRIGK